METELKLVSKNMWKKLHCALCCASFIPVSRLSLSLSLLLLSPSVCISAMGI